jgi:hypothetical protein
MLSVLSAWTKKQTHEKILPKQTAFNVFKQALGEADPEEDLTGKKADSQKGMS